MAKLSEPFNFLKKNRITIIALSALLVAMCCIFAFVGNESGDSSTEIPSVLDIIGTESESIIPVGNGVGIYIDGHFIAAVESEAIANAVFEELLSIRSSSLGINSAEEIFFGNEVSFVRGDYEPETFVDSDSLSALLGKKNDRYVASLINDYNGNYVPVTLEVHSVVTFTETVTLEYETKTVYTDSLRDGLEKVVSKGYNGEGQETYRVTSVNGVVTTTEVISLDVTVAPSDEIIRVGTRSNGKNVASLSTFQKPYDGIITSYVGPRWGRTHNGIDIVAEGRGCKGDPVYAAADGVVVRADLYGGYGNCVIIDHGNGVQTLYAHFSKLSVSAGDVVKAGDEVGKIGSTGNSTGPHLHFEVRVDGEFVNPLIFVDYE